MHKFMSAIGFRECQTKKQFDDLIKLTLSKPDIEKEVVDGMNRRIFQAKRYYANGIGISVMGEIDSFGFRNVSFAFPYLEGNSVTVEDEIQMQKFAEKDAFAGISEDYNIGVSLIFYLINIADYVEERKKGYYCNHNKVKLSALSTEGKILFGIERNEMQAKQERDGQHNRNHLIQQAKNGDMEAIESLTLDDIDLYTLVSRRAQTEDIYSIVDTTFMPFGVESDQYSIIGNIINVQMAENTVSRERIYILDIVSNDINMLVAINEKDLEGTPRIGYRFKGNIWMQGQLLMMHEQDDEAEE